MSPYQIMIQASVQLRDGVMLLYQDNLVDARCNSTVPLGEFEYDECTDFDPFSEFVSVYAPNLRILTKESGEAYSPTLFRQPLVGEHGSLANLQCLLTTTLQPEGTEADRSSPDPKDPDHPQQREFEWPFSDPTGTWFHRDPLFGWGTVFGTCFVSNTGEILSAFFSICRAYSKASSYLSTSGARFPVHSEDGDNGSVCFVHTGEKIFNLIPSAYYEQAVK